MTGNPPSPQQPRIALLIVQQCLDMIEAQGLSRDRLFQDAGILPGQLAEAGGWISFQKVEPVMRLGIERLKDPLIGLHISPRINLATLGVLGYAAQTSSTLKDLIETTLRFERLISDVGTTSLRHEPGAALWQWDCEIQDELVRRHATECIIGCWAGQLRLMKQRKPQALLAVRLQHEAPAEPRLVRETEEFFRCPVHYGQKESALVLLPQALNEALTLANPDLHQALEQHARQLLAARQTNMGVIDQVRSVLRKQLLKGEVPTRETLAAQLGMSGRSLHRKLEEEGSGFREILDAVRSDMARELLQDNSLSVDDVAERLGFQESQSFIRWFRRHAGTTPGDYRLQRL
jgi:AraC-like DNA-binding protein